MCKCSKHSWSEENLCWHVEKERWCECISEAIDPTGMSINAVRNKQNGCIAIKCYSENHPKKLIKEMKTIY